MEAAPDAILLVDTSGVIVAANRMAEVTFGYDREEMIGKAVEMLIPLPLRKNHGALVGSYLAAPRVRPMGTALDVRALRKNGSEFPAEISLSPLPTEQGLIVISILRDVTSQRRREQELESQRQQLEEANKLLEELATRDGLTGLKNHRSLTERLQEEWSRALRYSTPLSVLMLDIDRFKKFNDDFGHLAGDEVLQNVASLLQKMARETDFVARYGGEEFVVLLPATAHQGAGVLAERFRAAVAEGPWTKRAITCSVGSATFVPGIEGANQISTATALLAAADAALYQSKHHGRNRVTQSPQLTYAIQATSGQHD